jgi:exosortase/archaeosortase family protein
MQKPKSSQQIHLLAAARVTSNAALILKVATLTIATLLLHFQDLSTVFNDALHEEQTFHILVMPFLFAYLLHRKRKIIRAATTQKNPNSVARTRYIPTLIGSLLSATAVILYWYGSYTFTPLEFHILTLPLFAAGLILILFNAQTLRQLAFPIAFLLLLTPPPLEILYGIGASLSVLSSQASNALANAFGISSAISSQYGSPAIILTRPDHTVMNFTVDTACSGVYSLLGFTIFAIFIAYVTGGKLRSKAAILLMGIPLIITLNIIRITTILTVGYYNGDQLALQIYHLLGATVLMFIGTLILLAITEKAFNNPTSSNPCPDCNLKPSNPADESCFNCGKLLRIPKTTLHRNDIAKIAGTVAAIIILLSIQAPIFALTQGPAQITIQTPSGVQGNTQILPEIQGYKLGYMYRDTNFELQSGVDAALVYAYSPTDPLKATVWVAIQVAQIQWLEHQWELCLQTWPISQGIQPSVTQLDLRDVQTQANPPITARYFAFQYHSTNQTQVVLYWYETSIFAVNGTSQQKSVMISLISYPQSPQKVATAESQLLPFATAINDYWEPIKNWTPIILVLSQNGLVLSAATTALLIALLFYRFFLNRQDKASLLTLYTKLSERAQNLITAVKNAQKQKNPTTSGIAKELEKLTNKPVDLTWLTEKLEETQNTGLIKKQLTNKNDAPAIAWKNQVPDRTPTFKKLIRLPKRTTERHKWKNCENTKTQHKNQEPHSNTT